jgi:hypothetical protein
MLTLSLQTVYFPILFSWTRTTQHTTARLLHTPRFALFLGCSVRRYGFLNDTKHTEHHLEHSVTC